MAGNTRGKLKEELEGMHRNLDWLRVHAVRCADLCGPTHPDLVEMFVVMGDQAGTQDDILQTIYGTI